MRNALVGLLLLLVSAPPILAESLVLTTMDIRRSPTSAPFIHRTNPNTDAVKTVSFVFYTGDLWEQNPQSHAYLVMDGYITPGVGYGSLQGRGIIIGHTPNCKGVGFEKFGANAGYAEGCIPMQFRMNEFYRFEVTADPEKVSVAVTGPDVDEYSELAFTGEYKSFDTVMGVAFDQESSTYGIFNVLQVIE